ncbi:MAG TPA: DUF1501 domain-containing protein [Bdellovibrionales bacterium]|nr:DUF1501 domain-containing protein [Bdellovibrionales bacterium]
MNRREFFKSSILSMTAYSVPAAAPFLPWMKAFAQPLAGEPRFFIFVSMPGGADVTLGLDPWTGNSFGYAGTRPAESDMFIEYSDGEVVRPDGTGIYLGPAAAPLAPYAKRMTVFNGIVVSPSETGHTSAGYYMASGSSNPSQAEIAVELGHSLRRGAFGVLSSYGARLGNRRLPVTSISQLLNIRNLISNGFDFSGAGGERGRAQDELVANQQELQNFAASLEGASNGYDLDSSARAIAMTFKFGLSYQASVFASANLDSHVQHKGVHLQSQKAAFESVARLLKVLSETEFRDRSLLDCTTVMVTSEFSRTPNLVGTDGKDHNPRTNSAVVIGRGFETGKTIGASTLVGRARSQDPQKLPIHVGAAIRNETLAPAASADEVANKQAFYLRPDSIAKTILEISGVPKEKMTQIPASVPSLAFALK